VEKQRKNILNRFFLRGRCIEGYEKIAIFNLYLSYLDNDTRMRYID